MESGRFELRSVTCYRNESFHSVPVSASGFWSKLLCCRVPSSRSAISACSGDGVDRSASIALDAAPEKFIALTSRVSLREIAFWQSW